MYWKIEKKVIIITAIIYFIAIMIGLILPQGLISNIQITKYENGIDKEIFFHNVFLFLWSYILGIMTFGLYNIVEIFINGITLGYIFHSALDNMILSNVVLNILPHGIIEMPVSKIGWSFGIYILYINKIRRKNKEIISKHMIRTVIKIKSIEIAIGIILLYVAAIIESRVMV